WCRFCTKSIEDRASRGIGDGAEYVGVRSGGGHGWVTDRLLEIALELAVVADGPVETSNHLVTYTRGRWRRQGEPELDSTHGTELVVRVAERVARDHVRIALVELEGHREIAAAVARERERAVERLHRRRLQRARAVFGAQRFERRSGLVARLHPGEVLLVDAV